MMRPVWVIDDDRSIRWVFETALASEGIPFKTFAQATEAVETLDESMRSDSAEESLTGTPDILGQAQSMQEVFRSVGRLSQSSATVLITGESGTGKELVARALHRHSPRADKPFIAINTAAMPKDRL